MLVACLLALTLKVQTQPDPVLVGIKLYRTQSRVEFEFKDGRFTQDGNLTLGLVDRDSVTTSIAKMTRNESARLVGSPRISVLPDHEFSTTVGSLSEGYSYKGVLVFIEGKPALKFAFRGIPSGPEEVEFNKAPFSKPILFDTKNEAVFWWSDGGGGPGWFGTLSLLKERAARQW